MFSLPLCPGHSPQSSLPPSLLLTYHAFPCLHTTSFYSSSPGTRLSLPHFKFVAIIIQPWVHSSQRLSATSATAAFYTDRPADAGFYSQLKSAVMKVALA